MELNIKYFGILAELTGCQEEQLSFSAGNMSDVRDVILKKHPSLKSKDFQIAQNKSLIGNETTVDGTEIALLPPFSGG
jgi:molybdopterin synthase sulfur carrier subunit